MQLIGSPAGTEGLLINEQSLNTGLTGDVTNGMRTVIYDSSQCVCERLYPTPAECVPPWRPRSMPMMSCFPSSAALLLIKRSSL